MARHALGRFIEGIRPIWGQVSSELIAEIRAHLERLLEAPATEDWLAELHHTAPTNAELYRDPEHGFVLLAHTERAGLYRPPHDHGRSWVMYAVQRGEIEMGAYGRLEDPAGNVRLVKRGATLLRPGDVQVYLPGDIHDTRCMSDSALLYRFTERDLRVEDKSEHRITRYVQKGGVWTTGAS